MKKRRLLWQLFPANSLITLGAILLITWFGSSAVRDFYFNQMQEGLVSRAYLIEKQVVELIHASAADKLQNFCQQAGRKAATRITVVLTDGQVLADSNEDPTKMDNHANRQELQSAFKGLVGSSIRFSRTLGENMLYVATPLHDETEHIFGALRLSIPVTSLDRVLQSIYLKVLAGCIFVLIAAAFVTLFVSRKISLPLEEMKLGAERMANGDMTTSLTIDQAGTSSEVAGLATSLNRMAKQINDRMQTITLQRKELETVFSSMTEMVLAIDTDKKILRINRSAAALFYLSPDDVQGKHLHGVIRNDDLLNIVDQVFESGEKVAKDIIVYVGPDRLNLHSRAVPLQDEHRNPLGVLVVLNDMTRLYKLENLRREFVANVSHELKTPITSIQGYVETLLDGAIDNSTDSRRFLEIISRQTSRLDAIIDDLLMLSRIEQKTDQHRISLSRIQIQVILDSAVHTCRPKAVKKEISIEVDCDENLNAKVNPNLLEQAIINLLTNAITYSPEKSEIKIKSYHSDSPHKDRIVISVQDQGVGIAQEHIDRLFERFYRCDKGRSQEQGGTGLGLSIVKHIAMTHGGSVSVESQPEQGSIFSITIPSNADLANGSQ